jgi:hypothetical protein
VEEAPCGCQRVHFGPIFRTLKGIVGGAKFCTCKGTIAGVLQMSEDVVVGETTSVAKIGGSLPHKRFFRNLVRHVEAITIVMPVCRCSLSRWMRSIPSLVSCYVALQ